MDKKKKEKEKEDEKKLLIEDGTMASFGFNNPVEVKTQIKDSDKRK